MCGMSLETFHQGEKDGDHLLDNVGLMFDI